MSAEAIAAVQAELEREEEFLVDLTQQLVRIPTVNPKFEAHVSLNHEADLQHYLRMMLDEFGMRTENYDVFPGRANLIGTLPGGEARSLILCGHVDVVPVGDRRKWSFDPFGGEISDRRLYGRGALDMKSGLAAGVAVARAIARAGVVLDGRLELHAVVDGEAGGSGARDLVERGRHAAGLILMEPTWQALMPAGSGYEWVRVTFRGRSAHAAWRYNEIFPQPDAPERLEPGVNALTIAARFVTAVQELERDWTTRKPAHPLLPPGANTIHPGVMVCGAGTTATGLPQLLTNPAIVPDVAVIDFHIMFLPNETSEQIREEFEAFVDAFAAQDSWLRAHPPLVQWDLHGLRVAPVNTPIGHDLCRAVIDSRAAQKLRTDIKGYAFASSAAHYAGVGIPIITYGPGGGEVHGPDEYVDLDSLKAVTRTLASAVLRWCGVR